MKRMKAIFLIITSLSMMGCKQDPLQEAAPAADPNINVRDYQGQTALLRAVNAGQNDEVRRIIDSGADVNIGTEEGVTPLINAAGMGNLEVVRLLIEKGADVNKATKSNYTALMSASLNGHYEIVQLLLDSGADPNAKDKVSGKTALTFAEEKGEQDKEKKDYQSIAELLKQRAAENVTK
jgi:serine/threonine-protein phosphatase 6 regulatory ankyrin repeat subunit B